MAFDKTRIKGFLGIPSHVVVLCGLVGCAQLAPQAKIDGSDDGTSEIVTEQLVAAEQPSLNSVVSTASGSASRRSISFREVIQRTLADNPDIGIADAQLEDAEAAIDVAKAGLRPTVDLTVSSGVESTFTASSNARGRNRSEVNLAAEQVIYDFGARNDAVDRRIDLAKSADLRKEDSTEEVGLQVVNAYLEYVRNNDLVASAGRNVASHSRIARLVQTNEEGGNATKADVNRAQTRLESAKTTRLNAQNAREDAIAAFRRLTQTHPQTVRSLSMNPRSKGAKNSASLKARLLENPELLSLQADRESLEEQLSEQRAAIKPEFFLRGEANYKDDVGGATGDATDFRGVLGFRMRLFDGGSRLAAIRQIRARIKENDQRYEQTYRQLLQDAEQNTQSIVTANTKTSFVNERVSTARSGLRLFNEQFRAGERTAFELLDAQRDLFQAETDQINHRIDSAAARYQNLRLQGRLIGYLLENQ